MKAEAVKYIGNTQEMDRDLKDNEITLLRKLKTMGADEDSIIGITIIAIQEDIVNDVLTYINENEPENCSDILEFICPDTDPLEVEDDPKEEEDPSADRISFQTVEMQEGR